MGEVTSIVDEVEGDEATAGAAPLPSAPTTSAGVPSATATTAARVEPGPLTQAEPGPGIAPAPAAVPDITPEPAGVPDIAPGSAAGPAIAPGVVLAGGASVTFGDFYAGHFTELVRLATLLSGSADNAPDLVQDCFVRLHGRWGSVREPLPYLRRSVVHACASHHRHAAVIRRNPLPEPRAAELGADELEDALAALPARQRAAVVLRYYGDLPDADIARALRCREGTVRSLVSRALADLRKVIEP